MPSKGAQNHGCCCNDCESKLPEDVRCCCHCVCTSLCVTLSFGSGSGCSCDEVAVEMLYDCDTQSWHKTVNCGSLSVDLDFSVKTCDGKCYVCLTSECLDMEYGECPSDCVEFTPGGCFCRGTDDGIKRTSGFSATWTEVDFSGCGDSYCDSGTISIGCSEVLNIEKITDCGEPICEGCSCICACICVNVTGGGGVSGNPLSARVCYDSYTDSWHGTLTNAAGDGEDTFEIFIEKDDYDQCQFRLETTLGTVDEPDTLTECGDWQWGITDGNDVLTLSVRCAGCGDCDLVLTECCDNAIPSTVVATVTNELDCGCAGGAQIPLALTSLSNSVTGALATYEGTGDFGTCDHTIKITLQCRTPLGGACSDFELDYEFPDSCDGGNSGWRPSACSCDPFFLDYSDNSGSADGCCNPASAMSSFHFTVTE